MWPLGDGTPTYYHACWSAYSHAVFRQNLQQQHKQQRTRTSSPTSVPIRTVDGLIGDCSRLSEH